MTSLCLFNMSSRLLHMKFENYKADYNAECLLHTSGCFNPECLFSFLDKFLQNVTFPSAVGGLEVAFVQDGGEAGVVETVFIF